MLQFNYYDNLSLGHKKSRLCRRVEWQRPIFPGGCPPSFVGAEGLNDRVRDGNGCFPFAIVTTPPACTCGWVSSFLIGGDEGIRTPDLCRARAALFQLSYIPSHFNRVGLPGLEPGTSVLSGLRSNHLSYKPNCDPTQPRTEWDRSWALDRKSTRL